MHTNLFKMCTHNYIKCTETYESPPRRPGEDAIANATITKRKSNICNRQQCEQAVINPHWQILNSYLQAVGKSKE